MPAREGAPSLQVVRQQGDGQRRRGATGRALVETLLTHCYPVIRGEVDLVSGWKKMRGGEGMQLRPAEIRKPGLEDAWLYRAGAAPVGSLGRCKRLKPSD